MLGCRTPYQSHLPQSIEMILLSIRLRRPAARDHRRPEGGPSAARAAWPIHSSGLESPPRAHAPTCPASPSAPPGIVLRAGSAGRAMQGRLTRAASSSGAGPRA